MKAERLLELYDRISEAPDAVSRLRRFVLDLAVRGKLVEQDPGDDPASELLSRIEAERAQFLGGKSSKKVKALSAVEEPPFAVPTNWQWSRLGTLADIVRGVSFPASDKSQAPGAGLMPCLRSGNIQTATQWDDLIYVPESSLKNNEQRIRDGDVLISIANSYALVGKCSIVNDPPFESTFGAFLAAIRLHSILPTYAKAFLTSDYSAEAFRAGSSQTTNIANITFSTIRNHCIPVPPLAEQHRIVAKVDELMALCDRLEEIHNTREATRDRLTTSTLSRLTAPDTDEQSCRDHARFALDTLPALTARPDQIKTLHQTILDLAIHGKLVKQFPGDERAAQLLQKNANNKADLERSGKIKKRKTTAKQRDEPITFLLPNGWALTDLGSVAFKITDGAHKTPTYVENGIPFVSVKDFSGGKLNLNHTRRISESEHRRLHERCDPCRGDILIGRIGTLGRAVVVDTDVEFSIFVSVGLIRFDHNTIDPDYLCILLNSPFVSAEFDRIKVGGGSHTNKLNLGDLHTVALPIPPLAEQRRIVAKVNELMTLCDQLEASLTKAETTRGRLLESMLQAALQAAADEPELA